MNELPVYTPPPAPPHAALFWNRYRPENPTDAREQLGQTPQPQTGDPVNHPNHYTSHPSGIEAIDVTEHFNFNLGNCIKYVWRADLKGKPVEDLEKARFYLDREIARRKTTKPKSHLLDGDEPV